MTKPTVLAIGPSSKRMFGKHWRPRRARPLRKGHTSRIHFGANLFDIFRSIASTEITGVFNGEIVPLLPPSLKFITQNGVGYDNVDVAACTARGIRVSYTPHANDNAVADAAIFLMIGALRRTHNTYTNLRAGLWRGSNTEYGYDPEGKLLGIVGMGSIGRAMAKRARAFGMRVQYHNRHQVEGVDEDIA